MMMFSQMEKLWTPLHTVIQLSFLVIAMSLGLVLAKAISLTPEVTALFRAVIAWFVLMMFYPNKGSFAVKSWKHAAWHSAAGVFLAVSWICLFNAIVYGPLLPISLVLLLYPSLSALSKMHDPLGLRISDYWILIFQGIGLWMLVPEWTLENDQSLSLLLAFAGLIAQFAYNSCVNQVKPLYSDTTIMRYQWGIAALVMLPFVFQGPIAIGLTDLLLLLALGVVATFFARALLVSALMLSHPSFVGISYNLQPVVVGLMGLLFFAEPITWGLAGIGFMILFPPVLVGLAEYAVLNRIPGIKPKFVIKREQIERLYERFRNSDGRLR